MHGYRLFFNRSVIYLQRLQAQAELWTEVRIHSMYQPKWLVTCILRTNSFICCQLPVGWISLSSSIW